MIISTINKNIVLSKKIRRSIRQEGTHKTVGYSNLKNMKIMWLFRCFSGYESKITSL